MGGAQEKDRGSSVERWSGPVSLLLTPFREDGSIDWPAYDAYVDWQLERQPTALFAVCGSSEMKWLALEERLALARRAVARAGEVPVLATANLEPRLDRHPDELFRMAETGVAGVVLVPPPGLGQQPERLEEHFARLAQAAPVPVFLYEWPQVSPYLLDADVFGRLVAQHGVYGIKDTTCTLEGIAAKVKAAPGAVVYQANTPFLVEAWRLGARGVMAVTSAACADLVVALWRMAPWTSEEAAALHTDLVFLDAVLRMGYPATAKHLAALRGLPMGLTCRWPVAFPAEAAQAVEVCYARLRRSWGV